MSAMVTNRAAVRVWQLIAGTARIFSEIDAEQRAASFAYYAVFSLIPLITLLLSIGSIFFDPVTVRSLMQELIPVGIQGQDEVLKWVAKLQEARGGVSLVSVLILAWSSLKFFQALVRAVNRAWHTSEIPWWQMPIKNVLMLGVITSGLALGILIPALMQGITKALTVIEDLVHREWPGFQLAPIFFLIDLSRYLVGGAVLFYTITMLYRFAPRKRVLFRQIWLPALAVTVALQFCQVAFVNYLPRFVNYNAIYGPIGLLMLLLIWIYLSGILIIAGACLCAAWHNDPPTPESAKTISSPLA